MTSDAAFAAAKLSGCKRLPVGCRRCGRMRFRLADTAQESALLPTDWRCEACGMPVTVRQWHEATTRAVRESYDEPDRRIWRLWLKNDG
jgi:hypothetical protein